MDLSPAGIRELVQAQLRALAALAQGCGVRLQHVKPHGALYNRAAGERAVADAIACAVRAVDPRLALIGLANSALVDAARAAGLRALSEGFADRRYTHEGRLVPRTPHSDACMTLKSASAATSSQ